MFSLSIIEVYQAFSKQVFFNSYDFFDSAVSDSEFLLFSLSKNDITGNARLCSLKHRKHLVYVSQLY